MAELTYAELLAQKQEIEIKLAQAREREIAQAAIEINERMRSLGMTIADLGNPVVTAPAEPQIRRVPPKYKDPATGAVWAGRGHTPAWFTAAIDAGVLPASLRVDAINR